MQAGTAKLLPASREAAARRGAAAGPNLESRSADAVTQREPRAMVHIVDDDASIRQALTRLLSAAGYRTKSHASAGDFLLEADGGPGCILLDIRMPGPSGIDLHEALAKRERSLPVVFITGYGDVETGVRAIKAGAVDFLTKPVAKDVLLSAVAAALERDRRDRGVHERNLELKRRHGTLTAREREIFSRVANGAMNKSIAYEMGISLRTVKAHRARVMEKLGIRAFAELVRAAELLGCAPPPRADAAGAASSRE
ncbi:MAG TPA: response regulator [Casimicrobiaceae bacterium]|nr:response regulator [Casimicrobiaceae bacterium]